MVGTRGAAVVFSCRVESGGGAFPLVLVGLLSFLACLGFGLLAQVAAVPAPVPADTTVVQVRADDSLPDIARRMAPDSSVSQVVDRIMRLNLLTDESVRPGQSLVVPVGVHR
ncbi:MAG: LysM peptidoglycan-binding domain-containing protein [Kutzneria sp.]|nr:LysM peptidoglycan-binding domain-containing protein [Kutzneria sp.]MBV9846005.1 LysM peptidoglycan-binding domain-containing protein [Kutzneria sp.]